jgi:hypothetical protein
MDIQAGIVDQRVRAVVDEFGDMLPAGDEDKLLFEAMCSSG